MKFFLPLLFLLSFPHHSFAQRENVTIFWPEDPRTHRYAFTGNGYSADATSETLYGSAKQFAGKIFNSERDTVFTNDSAKTLICTGAFSINNDQFGDKGKGYVTYTFSIKCSNRFYKYSLTNFNHIAQNPDGVSGGRLENEKPDAGGWVFPVHYWNQLKAQSFYHLAAIAERWKRAMSKPFIQQQK